MSSITHNTTMERIRPASNLVDEPAIERARRIGIVLRKRAGRFNITASEASKMANKMAAQAPTLAAGSWLTALADEWASRPEGEPAILSAGFVPRFADLLRRNGMEVNVDYQDKARGPRNNAMLTDPTLPQEVQLYLQQIAGRPQGQILSRSPASQVAHLAALVHLYTPPPMPKLASSLAQIPLRVAVGTRNRRQRQWLHHHLRGRVDRLVKRQEDCKADQNAVFVATAPDFAACCDDHDLWDMFIVVGTDTAVSGNVWQALQQRKHTPRYCFRLDEDRLDEDDELLLERHYGPSIYAEPDPKGRLADMHVVMLGEQQHQHHRHGRRRRQRHSIKSLRQMLQWKRERIWNNNERNQLIAQLAVGLADGDQQLEQQLAAGWAIAADGETHKAVVLVENPEHAMALCHLMPGWHVEHDVPDNTDADETEYQIPAAAGNRSIVTMARASRLHIAADIIIRADATDATWNNAWGPRRAKHCRDGRQLIVDLDDTFDIQAQQNSRRRQGDYQNRSWPVTTIPTPATSPQCT